MKKVILPNGETVAALGQGTWNMGDDSGKRADEIQALQRGIDLGMTLIDTAEMYGEGASEELVGDAINGRRDQVFLVTKAYPHNASRKRLSAACGRSLMRLGTDRIDLYLLHWRGGVALSETVEAMEALKSAGKIRHWGVSNLDVDDMQELFEVGGEGCATDQVLYNLTRRGPEFDLLPFLSERHIPVMAYSPVEQGRLQDHAILNKVAAEYGRSAIQVALAWVLQREGLIAIPKAATLAHVEENARALNLALTLEDMAALDRAFPAPKAKRTLEMI